MYYEALVYLAEAERVLEYAASCGRTIDRALIVTTLHNQAAVYQRIWELVRSADYIEAIIYNVSALVEGETVLPLSADAGEEGSPGYLRLSSYLSSKLNLVVYHLQYCAVSSQIKNHSNALGSACQALTLLKTYCEQLLAFEKLGRVAVSANDFQRSFLFELQSIRDFQGESAVGSEAFIQKLLYKARRSLVVLQKRAAGGSGGLAGQTLAELEGFSLGQLMQIGPTNLKEVQRRVQLKKEVAMGRKVYLALYISIAHFTMATELRLIANERYGAESGFRKQSKEFRQSQAHHLVAIITCALYVPCNTKYFEHICSSFRNHYQIDLAERAGRGEVAEEDDLVHLEINSVSNQESEGGGLKEGTVEESKEMSRTGRMSKFEVSRQTGKSSLYASEKDINKTSQEMHKFASGSSSENSKLRPMNRTGSGGKSDMKGKSRKRPGQEKRGSANVVITEKVSKSKSKGKGSMQKRSKSRKSVHEEQKVVHYFQYDNYSRRVVSKKVKGKGPSELLKKKQTKEKKSPQAMIGVHLKKLNQMAQSNKDLISGEVQGRAFKKCKSPELSTSRSPNLLKKHK